MPDPLEQLGTDSEPIAPRLAFANSLRRQMIEALDIDAAQLAIDLPERIAMTTTTTTTTTDHPATATGFAPYLTVRDGAAAIDFYTRAFGAVEQFRVVGDDGLLGHAEMLIGDVRIQLSDEYPEMGVTSPQTLGGSGVGLSLTVTDCDALFAQAVDAGATSIREPADQDHGTRMAVLSDPFGHRWFLMQPLEEFDVHAYAERAAGSGFEVAVGAAAPPQRLSSDGIWTALMYRDAPAAIRFAIDVLGFTEQIVVADPDDPQVIHHSQLQWPEGGIVQFGTADRDGNIYSQQIGVGSLYVITADPESVLARCEAAGADIVDSMREVDYGKPGDRNFTVRDVEGNLWCFGTYAGEA